MTRAIPTDDRQEHPGAQRRHPVSDGKADDTPRRGFGETLPAGAKDGDAALVADDAGATRRDRSTAG